MSARSVLVTGAGGYIGHQVVDALAADRQGVGTVVAADVRDTPEERRRPGVGYVTADVRDATLGDVMKENGVDTVVHLAAVVTPGKGSDREHEYSIDVLGTRNVLECCLAGGVRKLILTSSGAAYGYHADNPEWLDEDDPLRGNPEFAYSDHKRIVEEMLARWREEHPEISQLVFRPGTVLGDTTRNQITALFDKRVVLGVAGSPSPFVFIWDQDVVACILRGIREDVSGIYNLAGDGALSMSEIARIMHKPYLPVPAPVLGGAIAVLRRLGLTQYGPEQVNFLRYRPVLSNRRLKEDFGYTPRRTSREVFEAFLAARKAAAGSSQAGTGRATRHM